jgi:hypothetical protein
MKTFGCRNTDSASWLMRLSSSSLLRFVEARLAFTEPSKAEVAEESLCDFRPFVLARGVPFESKMLWAMDSSCSRT